MYDYLIFDRHHGQEGYQSRPGWAPQIALEYQVLRKQYLDVNSLRESLDILRRQSPDFRAKPTKLIDKARYCLQSAIDDIESRLIYLEPHVLRVCRHQIERIERSSEFPGVILNANFLTEEDEVDISITECEQMGLKGVN